jgi:TolB-like protein
MATFSLKDFLREARRRRVFRVTALYIVGAFVALQVADLAFPGLGIKESAILYVWIGAILGLPIALFFGWRYDIIGGRIVRTPASDVDADLSIERADYIILGALSVVVAAIAFGLVGEISDTRIPGTTQFAAREIDPDSIAVLPFVNMSDDPSNEYFADGISEEILNLLARVPNLPVTSRSSAFSFKGQNLDIRTMAAKLAVAHVLEGSVRKSGNQVRITAQLIKVETDTHLWSQTYDRQLEDIFAIQDDVAGAVVDALKITLLGEKPKATETDPEAYALYLQARYLVNQLSGEEERAETLLKQALEFDPGFAPAWYLLGIVYRLEAGGGGRLPFYEGYELARQTINKALDADPQYGPAYAGLAALEMEHGWDFAAAREYMQQALALNPGDADTLKNAGGLNRILGRQDDALDLYRQAAALDPLSYETYVWLGLSYARAGRLDEAADSARMLLSLNPKGAFAHFLLGLVLREQGNAPAALVEMEQETHGTFRLIGTAAVQHELGNAGASDAALQKLIECCGGGEPPSADYQIAQVYAIRGEIDHAFEWLEVAYDNRDGGLSGVATTRAFSILHDDPRWEPFLDKMGLPHE